MTEEKAESGDTVQVHYTGTLDDGSQFDTSEGKDPLEFTLGSGQVIKGFDEAIEGMKVGDEKEIDLKSEEAYGPHHEKLVQEVPKERLPEQEKLEPGVVLALRAPTGQQAMATVKEIKDDVVVLDLNHPLAGKNLHFKLKLVGITEGSEEGSDDSEEEGSE